MLGVLGTGKVAGMLVVVLMGPEKRGFETEEDQERMWVLGTC